MRNGTTHQDGDGYHGGGYHGGQPPAAVGGRRATRFAVAVRGTLDATRRVLVLVWGTHRGLTTALAVLTLLRSAVPAGEVWLGKLVIDAVAGAITSGEGTGAAPRIVLLAAAALGLAVASSLLRTLANTSQQLLQERVAIRVQLLVMEHAHQLDLAVYENPRFYDQLQQAQR